MPSIVKKFQLDEAGATAIEYSLIAALLGVVVIGTLMAFHGSMAGMYDFISSAVAEAVDPRN